MHSIDHDQIRKIVKEVISENTCPHCGGPMVAETELDEKQDACYYKVKRRYKVWPSAYASGALVQCRKKGAKNWGTKTEAANPAQQAAIAISMKKAGKKPKSVDEGAKVDRMVKHIAKSEKKLGHSKKDAESIAWATANKRGYLDNKNKKAH